MKALVLAAGEGTRLRPLTNDRPKPMLPVGGRPVLEHLLGLLRQHGIRDVAVNLHYMPESIVGHFGDGHGFGVRLTYSYEERLLGSAGAAARLAWFLDEPFVVLYGDVLTDVDLTAVVAAHRARRPLATIVLYRVEDPSRCGIVEVGNDGAVQRFVEKPAKGETTGNLANAGIYVLEPEVLAHVPAKRPADFGADVFPDLVAAGRPVYGVEARGYVLDMGSPERYRQAQADWLLGRFHSAAPADDAALLAVEEVRC